MFFGNYGGRWVSNDIPLTQVKHFSSWIDLSNGIQSPLNIYRMQKIHPREVDISTNHLGAGKTFTSGSTNLLTFHLLGLGFWMFTVYTS